MDFDGIFVAIFNSFKKFWENFCDPFHFVLEFCIINDSVQSLAKHAQVHLQEQWRKLKNPVAPQNLFRFHLNRAKPERNAICLCIQHVCPSLPRSTGGLSKDDDQ